MANISALHPPESYLAAMDQAAVVYNVLENYTLKITCIAIVNNIRYIAVAMAYTDDETQFCQ